MKILKNVVVLAGVALLALGCGDTSDPSGSALDARIEELFPTAPTFGTVNREQVRRMLETSPEDDRPFYMVNLIRHRERAQYQDGRETNLSGRQADDVYGGLIVPILLDIGARLVFVADVEINLVDPDGEEWDRIGVVLYPSRADFLAMLEREDMQAATVHKDAGVEKSLVLVGELDGEPLPDTFFEVDLPALPFPTTPEDPPIAIVHLNSFHEVAQYADGRSTDLSGREAMALYQQGRQQQNVIAFGVRPGLWLRIEGEFIGDGRRWDEFQINNFPNRRTFGHLASQETLSEAGIEHRNAALASAYSQMTAPLLTSIGYR